MVLAYKKGEDINIAIPMDIIEVKDKRNLGFLALKTGKYDIVAANQKGDALKFELKVK